MPSYPATRAAIVTDVHHGVSVCDPYRWLENGASDEVRRWTQEQNLFTRNILDGLPERDAIHARLAQLLGLGRVTAPVARNGRHFYLRQGGSHDQDVLCLRDRAVAAEHELLDPSRCGPEGTSALDWWYPSSQGRFVAYGLSSHGDERSTLVVRDVETGHELPDRIPYTRLTSLAWLPDDSGFYYTRNPDPTTVLSEEEFCWKRVFLHALGHDWRSDQEVPIERGKYDIVRLGLSSDGRWLWIGVWQGWQRNALYVLDRMRDQRPVAIVKDVDAQFYPEVQDQMLYVRTNLQAPHFRVIGIDLTAPSPAHWREIIPERPDVLESHSVLGRHLVCHYLRNASSALVLHRLDGVLAEEIALPSCGYVTGWAGEDDSDDLFFGFVSFDRPPAIYRHTITTGGRTVWVAAEHVPDDVPLVTHQVWFESRDRTLISMFVVHRRGLELDGNRPTLLYGYGGFGYSLTPTFLTGARLLLERDGVFAMPHLRGGGEYGETWHRAGMRHHKQRVFDDCIAAAEWLIDNRYTTPQRLAVQGASNGGLLVGAIVTQRPDLFKAGVCQVPLLDMLRYHLFGMARFWTGEYGSSEERDDFHALHAYCPYHRVVDGVFYPSLLITTGEEDSRVDPAHARKFAARMQKATKADRPILLRAEPETGHGPGKPLSKLIPEMTDVWAFLLSELGVSTATAAAAQAR